MTKDETPAPNRLETLLAYMGAGVIGLSLVSLVIAMVTRLIGAQPIAILSQLPLIGLPVGFVLVITLLIVSLVRRSRENQR